MENLIKQFEKESGLKATIESDLYADGEIYAKEYTEWLEKRIQALSMSGVVGRSEQLSCEHSWKEYEGPSCRIGWKCSKCKDVKHFAT